MVPTGSLTPSRLRRLPPDGDRHWHSGVRYAVGCALALCGLTFLLDWGAGTLTPARALLWPALSAVLLLALLPQRVTAGRCWLAVRGPLRRHLVRTDALTEVRQCPGLSASLVLRDVFGHRVELDPRVLAANPLLWHDLDTGARRSLERGTLREGAEVLERLRREIDDETARAVLERSGIS
ncbi:hypothetical protein FNH09_36185 [Streptomyces adustus]|uniref:Uncharacterized protein n=1 Tax=Streptomyces adustus TaxID=1609272 RepID=A0A5N8VMI2_9ACTN|nr:hypothetical protein [Streptomyces adustus]MPY36471.1 hypothetical protein [Streptomyces adustus]